MRITSLMPRSEVLQGRRLEIYETIRGEPGIHFRAIQRETGIPAGTAKHHLNVLERLEYVRAREVGPRRCYVTRHGDLDCLQEAVQYAARPEVQPLVEAVATLPGQRQCDYQADFPDTPRSTVQNRLNRLADFGVLRKIHRQGTAARYWINAEAPTRRDERG